MNGLEIVGIVCIAIVAFFIVKFILSVLYNNVLGPTCRINAVDLTKTGKWAVVTGATDGIGKAYAEELAKKNLNIVLISRTQTKLDDVAANLQKQYKVETKTISADFNKSDIYEDINKQLQGMDIGVLINNVGLYYPYPEYFLDLKNGDQIYNNIITCNILSVVHMCKIVLPGMVKRKRGVIVNISSATALIHSPLVSVYSASKAYVEKFSEDLATEYTKDGVTIQCLFPAYVATKMVGISIERWTVPFPERYVKSAIKTIGVREKTNGYFPHTLQIETLKFINSISSSLCRRALLKEQLKVRSKFLNQQVP